MYVCMYVHMNGCNVYVYVRMHDAYKMYVLVCIPYRPPKLYACMYMYSCLYLYIHTHADTLLCMLHLRTYTCALYVCTVCVYLFINMLIYALGSRAPTPPPPPPGPRPGRPLLPAVPDNLNEPKPERGKTMEDHTPAPPPAPYQTIPLGGGGGWERQRLALYVSTAVCMRVQVCQTQTLLLLIGPVPDRLP